MPLKCTRYLKTTLKIYRPSSKVEHRQKGQVRRLLQPHAHHTLAVGDEVSD